MYIKSFIPINSYIEERFFLMFVIVANKSTRPMEIFILLLTYYKFVTYMQIAVFTTFARKIVYKKTSALKSLLKIYRKSKNFVSKENI